VRSGVRKTLLVVLAVSILAVGLVVWKQLGQSRSSDVLLLSGVIEADEVHIGSRVGGRIAEVLVEQGQEVRAGQPLIRFESYDLPARRTTAAAGVARAQAELDRAVNGFRPEEIAQARAQAEAAWMALELARSGPRKQEIDAARADRDAARADYELAVAERERVEALFKSGVVSRQDLDSARSTHDRAKARLEAAGQKLDLLEAGTRTEEIERTERLFREAAARRELVERGARKEDIRAARAQVERAQAELQTIEAQLAEIEVRSPSDAFVEVMRVRPGDLIAPNAAIATLVEVDRLWVRVFVPSTELGHVQLGKEAAVTVDSFRDETFSGRVEHISSRGEFTPRNVQTYEERQHQVFAVRLRLDNAARRLRPGMAADVRITR
jgi:multidrug resistance efflux pump